MIQEAGETLVRMRPRSTNHDGLPEVQLLRAAESDNIDRLREIIDAARTNNQLNENFLRIGLMRSSEKGNVAATQYLLSQGAKPDGAAGNRLSPLLRAVERNNVAIVQLLLAHGADRETRDKKGRTALMTAAWKNHWHILNLLIAKGADVNGKDNRGRNILHNLAADKQCDWGDEVIQLLLDQDIDVDGKDGQDELKRSPLHWACATGKLHLAEQFLTRSKRPRANVNAVEYREKTSLHIAAAHDRNDIVELLLKFGADVNAKSDGGWTPLHNACEKGCVEIVRILLEAGADINAKLLNGMAPLHLAAQGEQRRSGQNNQKQDPDGDPERWYKVVRLLLARKDIKRAQRDTFGFTPFLRAAQNKRRDIVTLLAPLNQVEALSEDALGACNGFSATIVDFGDFRNENRVKKQTVYELLYGRDSLNPRKPAVSILPQDRATKFRWIHLPANNMAWVEALLTKAFIEEGASDVDGFKSLERSFNHQHRGQQSHSHFMRPLCQSTPRAARVPEVETKESSNEQEPPVIVINGRIEAEAHQHSSPGTPAERSASSEGRGEPSKSSPQIGGKENIKSSQKDKGKKAAGKNVKSPKIGTETPTKEHRRKQSYPLDISRPKSPRSTSRKDPFNANRGNVFTFMPYLHFETTRRRQEMQDAIKRAEMTMRSPYPRLQRATTYDEMLIRAHLATSTVSLHVRRTLDQSFYHNIDTEDRDVDQVVYRYQLRGKKAIDDPECDPKIVMVDQLWMWILGKDLIVTSFPQRWQQPKNDPLNVLDSIIEDINSKTREPVKSVYDLAMIITNRCSGVFSRHRMGDEDYQFLDMFESSIGNVTDRETVLFKEFNTASGQASAWLQHHRRPNRFSRYLTDSSAALDQKEKEAHDERFKFEEFMRGPLFVDKLLDIGQETDLLAETKDIRDELNMIAKVLEDQLQVLPDLEAAICDIYQDEQISQRDVKKRFEEQLKAIKTHIKDIDRMDKQAERIYKSITDMLDLKQKHANAFEARFARDQAAGTARQSQTIMVFTIVTIVFLPLSFIAAFFAINISEFPRASDGSDSLPLGYVSKYMFGIGFAVSIPLIVIALLLEDIGDMFQALKRKLASRRAASAQITDAFGAQSSGNSTTLDIIMLEKAYSGARSRRSHDTHWAERPLSRETAGTGHRPKPEIQTGFRLRVSQDIERGLHI